MKTILFAAGVCVALALPMGSFAQTADTYENRLAVASGYVEQSLADMDIEAMIRTMYTPVLDQVRAQGQQVTDAQIAEIDALYVSVMRDPMLNILRRQDEIMADLLSLEEITALAEFYATPIGRSVMVKLPLLTERLQPQIMEFVQQTMPQLIPELQRILR